MSVNTVACLQKVNVGKFDCLEMLSTSHNAPRSQTHTLELCITMTSSTVGQQEATQEQLSVKSLVHSRPPTRFFWAATVPNALN